MKTVIWLVVLLASVVKVPPSVVPQNGSSTVSSKDRRIGWTAQWGMEQVQLRGKRAIQFTEEGTGNLSAYPEKVRWSVRAVWLADEAFLPVETVKTITTMGSSAADRKTLLMERKQFDHEKSTVRFDRRKGDGATETKSLDVPADTLAIEGLAGVLRFVDVDEKRPFSAHVLTNDEHIYSVTFEWRGAERVKTPAGEFACYKIEMVPHLGVLNLIRPFLSKTSFWFTAAAPNYWIRYEGPESGPGTPDVAMELSSGGH